jgi:hypothetical protein
MHGLQVKVLISAHTIHTVLIGIYTVEWDISIFLVAHAVYSPGQEFRQI